MGLRGPPPVPTPILKARGSRLVPGRDGEVAYAPGLPKPPRWLGKEARAEWKRMAKHLEDAGVAQQTDGPVLAAWCEAVGDFDRLAALCEAGDPAKDWRLWNLKNAAADRLVRMAAQFGFTPSARARVKAPEKEEGKPDGVARFFA